MKKNTSAILFFFISATTTFANGYLDSLFNAYNTAKTDTTKYNLLQKIFTEQLNFGSINYNPDTISSLLDKTLQDLSIKKDISRLESFLDIKASQCYDRKKYNLSNFYCDSCIHLAEKLNDFLELGGMYELKHQNYLAQSFHHNAVEALYKSIEYYKKAKDIDGEVYELNQLGDQYRKNQQNDMALAYYLKAAPLSSDSFQAGMIYASCSYIEIKKGNLEAAEVYLKKTHAVIYSPHAFQHFYYYIYYGIWLKAMNRNDEALQILSIAFEENIKGNHGYQRPWVLYEMAEVYIKKKIFGKAKEILDKAILIDKELGRTSSPQSHPILSKYYEATNQPLKALEELKITQALKERENQSELTSSLTSSDMEFEYNKKEQLRQAEQRKIDEEKEKKLRHQKIIAYSSGSVLVFVGFISFLLYRNNRQQKKANITIAAEKKRSEDLLLNILPEEVAEELKINGSAKAKDFDEVTVLFTDFKNFTSMTEQLSAQELVNEINYCYCAFDNIITKFGIEKIKTIGDSYMCAGGLPVANKTNAGDTVKAALEIRDFVLKEKKTREAEGEIFFDIRIGLHTGPVIAGIVGIKKFAYDIWGDTVNIASRMESSGEAGKVNISGETYQLIKDKFNCTYRGKIEAKNKGMIDMYFVES